MIDEATGESWRFEGQYTLKAIGGSALGEEDIRLFTEEEIQLYNNQLRLHSWEYAFISALLRLCDTVTNCKYILRNIDMFSVWKRIINRSTQLQCWNYIKFLQLKVFFFWCKYIATELHFKPELCHLIRAGQTSLIWGALDDAQPMMNGWLVFDHEHNGIRWHPSSWISP